MWTRYLSILLAVLLLTGCTGKESGMAATSDPTEVADFHSGEFTSEEMEMEQKLKAIHALGESPDDNYRTWYEIFVYSFCDSNADGIGDIPGVISKLDYLQELGITGIWLMPIHPSPSYHKYDVTNYYAIHPEYGTMEDFEALLQETEKRGIKVIMDLVLNHTGNEHPWFVDACAYLAGLEPGSEPDPAECPSVAYYNFVTADACPSGYHSVPGTQNWYYEGQFSPNMPDVNFGSKELRAEQTQIMKFWLDKGVDGFRLDAAKEFYTGETAKNVEVLNWIQTTAKALNPDCYLVAEVWDSFMALASYYESDITSLFNFAFGNSNGKIAKVLRAAGDPAVVSTYAAAQQKAYQTFAAANPDFIDAPFLSNHDVGRIAGFTGRDEAKTKLAGAMNLFMGGSAFIYYGEELGMVCGALDDPSYRAPMYWNAERDSGTTEPPPGCTLPDEYLFGSLAEQKTGCSVYNYYRQAVAIRNSIPSIARGIPTVEEGLNTGCISAVRKTWNNETCVILMNISETEEEANLAAYTDWNIAAELSVDDSRLTQEDSVLHIPAFGVVVLMPDAAK